MNKIIYIVKIFNYLIISKQNYLYSFIGQWFWTNYILQGAKNERGKNG